MQTTHVLVNSVEKLLQASWYKPTSLSFFPKIILRCVLWPLSQIYRCLAFSHKSLYKLGVLTSHKLSVPVVVVGNIVTGGGGKTPTVIALVEHLRTQGIKVGVISRGYGRHSSGCLEVKRDSDVSIVGDEPLSILKTLDFNGFSAPVFVAKKRVDAAKSLIASYPDTQVIISDDGLQHHALQHDIAITVFDDRGLGNGLLLPAGPLRESTVKTEQTLVLHTGNHAVNLPNTAVPQFTARRDLANFALKADGGQVKLSKLNPSELNQSSKIVALAGIANPEAFFEMLRKINLNVTETVAMPDHASQVDYHYIFNSYSANKYAGYRLVCTVKDAVKLWQYEKSPFLDILAIPLDFKPEAAFFTAFDALLKLHLPSRASTLSP